MSQPDQQRFGSIEAYVLGTLPAADRERFEQELATDPDLVAEVQAVRENVMAIELGGLTREMQLAGSAYAEKRGAGMPSRLLKLAAGVALLISLGTWWFTRPTLSERLFAEYHVVDPGLPVPMSSSTDHAFHDAMVDLKMGAYEKALAKWSALPGSLTNTDTLRFYMGVAQLEGQHPELAVPAFKAVANDAGSVFRHKAEWYLLLTYLKTNNTSAALNMAIDPTSPFADRAATIQHRLRE